MGNKISCANCNGKPSSAHVAGHQHQHHHQTSSNTGVLSSTTSAIAAGTTIGSNVARSQQQQYQHHYHQSGGGGSVVGGNVIIGTGSGGGGGGGAPISNILTAGRSNHILRLWAEVFHVSASSGAVRWNQVSDDLVPVTVSFINGRYHITAFNSRVEKVLDCWLQSNKLGQASSCFIYWKDNVSGDTWGLNFTSPADARAFRECIQSGTIQLQTTTTSSHGPKRTESSYSLRAVANAIINQDDSTHQQPQQQQQSHGRQSKAGSGAHLTTKYYSNRTALSTPNSPSKRRLQQQQQQQHQQIEQLQQQQQQAYGQQQPPQCTCDCLTAEMLHKQRNGRIRYANFTRQDSGGTTQSSRSDGSLIRRQHERQQQYYRSAHQRSMDEHYRNRVSTTPASQSQQQQQQSRTLGPSHRHSRIQPIQSNQPPTQRIQMTGSSSGGGGGHQSSDNYPTSVQNGVGGSYIQIQHQKAIVHSSGGKQQDQQQQQIIQDQQQQQQQPSSRPQSQAQTQTQQLVSTATTTDDLETIATTGTGANISQQKRSSTRPKSLVTGSSSGGGGGGTEETRRDRTHRSLEGRRRSLERMQCVDLTDSSPTIPIRDNNRDLIDYHRPSAAQLEEYERELRRRLLHGGDSSGGGGGGSTSVNNNDALETFETLLKESMDDVANLMREVQHELTLIRAEEKRYQSQSTQSLHRIASAANLYGPGSLYASGGGGGVRSPIPQFDTMSIDGQLPFLPSFASSLAQASSAYHHHQQQQHPQQQNTYQSWDRIAAGYLTSSEISDDDRASLTTAISDDEDIIATNTAATVTGNDRYLINHHQPSTPKSQINHRQSKHSSTTAAISFECLGSVRKSGFLSVKKWLIRKRHSLELARKRGWKGYWVCLKGTTLLFYSCDANMIQNSSTQNIDSIGQQQQQQPKSGQSSTSELTPKHLIFVDECLVQPVPEHPRRDNVFCLSTSFGDAYLFDATSLPERDQWIQVIHTACAAQIARNSGRCTISHYLVEQYQRIEQIFEQDYQQRQEAELLLSCCQDDKQKQQLINHIFMLDEKIERNRIEIFRLKSYFAALTNDEGPNPKTLLSQASRRTKAQLNRIGVFTVSSLHAFNCAKNPQTVEKSLHRQNSFGGTSSSGGGGGGGGGGVGGRGSVSPIIPSNDSAIVLHRELYSPHHHSIDSQQQSQQITTGNITPILRVQLTILLMTGEQRQMDIPQTWTSEQLLSEIFDHSQESREYFLRCSETGTILYRNDLVVNYNNHTLIITPKLLFTIDLVRESNEMLFGFSVESELLQHILRVFVMRVEPNSIAAMHGLCRHDEIMVINGALVQELDMMFVESILQEELTLCLMIRSSRLDVPTQGQAILKVPNQSSLSIDSGVKTSTTIINQQQQQQQLLLAHPGGGNALTTNIIGGTSFDTNEKTSPSVTDDLIESLVCPPPPSTDFSQLILSDIQLSKYIVPKVDHFLPTSENLTSMNVIHQQQQQQSNQDGLSSLLMTENYNDHHHQGDDDRYITTTTTTQDNHHLQQLLQQQQTSDEQQQQITIEDIDCQLLSTDTGPPLSEAIQMALNQCHEQQNIVQQQQQSLQLPLPPPPLSSTQLLSSTTSSSSSNINSLKHMEKLIKELLDTENSFCHSLKQLVDLYLEPLSKNNFLTITDIKVLFGSILKVIDAQNEFRSELQEVGEHILGDCELLLKKCQIKFTINNNEQEQPTVNDLGVGYIADCFAKHSKNFRDYSTFCASHARAVKLMAQEKTAVHEWLQKQSNGQISQSLESYLIRPIQRVLKYPLLLGQMKTLCSKGTTNYCKLEDAIKDLEKVAEHINEMQRLQEEYGAIFEHLARNHQRLSGINGPLGSHQTSGNQQTLLGQNIVDLSPPALKHYGNVDWINSMEFLGKNCRKGVEWSSICFVFSQCVVFLCKETIRQRKRMPTAKSIDVEIIRHQVLIPVIEVQVRACPQNDSTTSNNETDFKWELIQLKMNAGKRSEKIYRLSNKTSEERNEFLRVIRQIIREDVRRMNVTVNVSLSSTSIGSKYKQQQQSKNKSSTDSSKNRPSTTTSKAMLMMKSNVQRNDDQQQQQHQHHHHHHKVPCGLCGKEIALGHHQRQQQSNKDQLLTSATTTTTRRQDSSSTTSH